MLKEQVEYLKIALKHLKERERQARIDALFS